MLTQSDLNQFTGTENWYRHSLCQSVIYTDGVKYLAETAGAYWLLDKIATLQMLDSVKAERFQVWKLRVDQQNSTATLTCEDGNDNAVYTEEITFTDFPLQKIDLYYVDSTILLPSEY